MIEFGSELSYEKFLKNFKNLNFGGFYKPKSLIENETEVNNK